MGRTWHRKKTSQPSVEVLRGMEDTWVTKDPMGLGSMSQWSICGVNTPISEKTQVAHLWFSSCPTD